MSLRVDLSRYRARDLRDDLVAGALVTAVAVPLGVGFAEVAGAPPVVGLYTSLLPLVGYALLGSSRHLKIGLDAASSAMVAAALAPLVLDAGGGGSRYLALASLLTLLVGLITLAAGLLRLGVVANLVSSPVLVGYQTGIALTVIVGQLPKLLGLAPVAGNDIQRLARVVAGLAGASLSTVAVGATALLTVRGIRRLRPTWPGPLIVLILLTAASAAASFQAHGVAVLGAVPSGLPALALPPLDWHDVGALVPAAAGIALVTSTDVILTSQTFAVRLGYRVSPSRDITGLGAATLLSAISGGLPAAASYARTAISERAGSRTQVSSVAATAAMAGVLLVLTGPLRYVPHAVLGAVVVDAVLGLVDVAALRRLWRARRGEFVVALATIVGVLVVGILYAIALAVLWSVLVFLRRVVAAEDAVLGRRAGRLDWYAVDRYPDAVPEPGLIVFRWDAPLFFANAATFRQRLLERLAKAAGEGDAVEWLVVDGSAMSELDVTAVDVLAGLAGDLAARGVALAVVEPQGAERDLMVRSGLLEKIGSDRLFDELSEAVAAFRARPGTSE